MSIPEKIGIFSIERVIAETKKSVVYLARQPPFDRQVAIKKLRPNLPEERIKQFQKEGPRLAALGNHRHLTQVFWADTDESDKLPYLVMRYIPGPTLEERLKEDPFTEKEATEIFREVLEAVAYLHKHEPTIISEERRIIHHDVIPRNIILAPAEGAVLVDLGSALSGKPERYEDHVALGNLANELNKHSKNSSRILTAVYEGVSRRKIESVESILEKVNEEDKRITRRRFVKATYAALLGGALVKIGLDHKSKSDELKRKEEEYEQSLESSVERIRAIPEDRTKDLDRESSNILSKLAAKYERLLAEGVFKRGEFPYYIGKGARDWTALPRNWDWTSGHLPGILWMLAEATNSEFLKKAAIDWTEDVAESHADDEKTTNTVRVYHSYVKAHKHTNSEKYKDKSLEAVNRLRKIAEQNRYLKHLIKNGPRGEVLFLDHMDLAIPFLCWAYRQTKDESLGKLIREHSDITSRVLINEDGSSIQCATFSPEIAERDHEIKVFGYSSKSCLARSHARAIKGFAEVYRTFSRPEDLEIVKRLISYVKSQGVLVSPYDYKDPSVQKPLDTSSTALLVSTLRRIPELEGEREYSDKVLKALVTGHLATEKDYRGLLRRGFMNRDAFPEVTTIYGDYNLIEALTNKN